MRRHEITEGDVTATPIKALIATAAGPNGSKRMDISVDLRTHAFVYIVNGEVISNLTDAVNTYNEAPGP
jgi:hypothetical protein